MNVVGNAADAVEALGCLAANAARWGLVDSIRTVHLLNVDCREAQRAGEVIAALEDLFRALVNASTFVLSCVHGLQGQQWATIVAHLPLCVLTVFIHSCTLQPSCWPALLAALPASVRLVQLDQSGPWSPSQLAELLTSTQHPVELELYCFTLRHEWKSDHQVVRQVQRALAARGRHVAVDLTYFG